MMECKSCPYLEESHRDFGKKSECYRCGHPDQDWILRFFLMRGLKGEPGVILKRRGQLYIKTAPQFCPYKFKVQRERRQANAKTTQSNT